VQRGARRLPRARDLRRGPASLPLTRAGRRPHRLLGLGHLLEAAGISWKTYQEDEGSGAFMLSNAATATDLSDLFVSFP
jgi:hypothetical protein